MAKVSINSTLNVPDTYYPMDETLEVKYLVAYQLGKSLRVLGRFSDYLKAADFFIKVNRKNKVIIKSIINLQVMIDERYDNQYSIDFDEL